MVWFCFSGTSPKSQYPTFPMRQLTANCYWSSTIHSVVQLSVHIPPIAGHLLPPAYLSFHIKPCAHSPNCLAPDTMKQDPQSPQLGRHATTKKKTWTDSHLPLVHKIIAPTRAVSVITVFNGFIFAKLCNRKTIPTSISRAALRGRASVQPVKWKAVRVRAQWRLESRCGDYSHCICVKKTPMCLRQRRAKAAQWSLMQMIQRW